MSNTALQKQQLHFKALKDLEAGIPIDPTLIISGAVSLAKIIAELFAKRSMLKARVTAIEALNATIVAVNVLQDERIADLENRLTILEGK
jgi:hypothetical protein